MIELFRVTGGRVSAIHRAAPDATHTLCHRPVAGFTPLPSDPWSAMGFRAASGPCQRCSAAARPR